MENNQEHKIDKIFKHSLDNQSVTPPADAWMAVHTYTIGQEEKKPKVWLRYAALGLMFLLFSGVGLYYLNLDSSDSRISGLDSQSKIQKAINQQRTTFRNSNPEKINSKISTLNSDEEIHKSFNLSNPNSDILSHELLVENTNNGGNGGKLLSHEVDWSGDQPRGGENAGRQFHWGLNPDSVENFTYSNDNIIFPNTEKQIETIESKPLVLNDLTEAMQKECEKKIVALEENIVDKKEVFKADSVVYGKRFSLKHPILNFRLGLFNSSVSINAKEGGNNPFSSDVINPNSIYGFSGIIGIAWKLNKKSRISLNSKFVSYSAINAQSKSAAAYVDPLSPTNKPTGTFQYNASRDVYEYLTPFGYLTQPVDPKFSFTPKDFDVRLMGSIKNLQIGINYEHDLISFRNKKGGIPAMEIYGLVGLDIQYVLKYNYYHLPFKNYDPTFDPLFDPLPVNNTINLTPTELGNGSSIVFGYNTGLGIRFQLSKGFGLNISGNYESNINSWVKDLPFKTRLSVLSVEGGFFVNL